MAGGGKEWYLIRRLKCTDDKCKKLHNELPDCMFPYKHYDCGLIEDVVEGVISEEDLETEDYPCEGTIKHWKWWMVKTRESLLEGLKERISPGWLKAAARFIYNAGGRIQPYPNGL